MSGKELDLWYCPPSGGVWPIPGDELWKLEWALRYGKDMEAVRYHAASVVAAYAALIRMTDARRRKLVSELKLKMWRDKRNEVGP
jgi:hypothetical protein